MKYILSAVACLAAGASAFAPNTATSARTAVSTAAVSDDRRSFIGSAAAASLSAPLPALAEVVVPDQFTDYSYPKDWGLAYKYDEDAAKVREHMIIATGMGKGATNMEDFGKNMKKEMIDFVSYYRRFPKVAGKPSFSTLYTSINVLAGHYTSYGYKYPLPEKRRKRLYQEYAEVDKSLKRNR